MRHPGLSWLGAWFLAWLALGSAARAQRVDDLPEALTLDRIPELVRRRSLRLRVAETEVDYVAADRIEARTPSNPVVSYELGVLASGANVNGVVQHEARIEQRIPLPSVRRARTEAADRAVDAAEAGVASYEAELVDRGRRAFLTLWLAERRLAIVSEAEERVRDTLRFVEQRVRGGAMPALDLARMRIEARELEAERAEIDRERLAAAADLATLLFAPDYRPRAEGPLTVDEGPGNAETLVAAALASRPSLLAARRELEAAQAALRAERTRARPAPSVVGGGLFTQGPGSGAIVGGVSLPLPLFDRNQAGIERARARVDGATRNVEALEMETRTEVMAALARVETSRNARDAFRIDLDVPTTVLPELVVQALRSGAADAYQLLDALRASRLAGVRMAELEAELVRAELDLLRLAGAP